jgi:Ca-activated chloride channel family protein
MRRVARWSLRAGILVLLALALRDPSLPGAGPRKRVYLIDVSASARKATGTDALTPNDALRLASHDLASLKSGDLVALIAFAAKPAVVVPLTPASNATFPARIEGVDPSSTDLPAALDMAGSLAEGGEIILFSDGRSTAGRAPAERIRVPVHSFPLGPLGGVDASIRALDAPASAPPGFSVGIRITVETTGPWKGEWVAGEERRPLEFTGPGRQDVVLSRDMPRDGRGLEVTLKLSGASPDLCPENDEAVVNVWAESQVPRVLVVRPTNPGSVTGFFREPDWIPSWAPDLKTADQADVIMLQDLRADAVSPAELDRLAGLVRDQGVGLVMLGGSSAFALGGWNGTPVEDLLPFWAFPDERSAVVLVLDRSGSMNEPAPGRTRPRIDEAAAALRLTLQAMHDDDEVALVTFADAADLRCPLVRGRERGRAAAALQNISGGRSTVLSEGLTLAGSVVKSSKAGRRHIVLVTDGRSEGDESAIRSAALALKEDGIGVTLVRIGESTTPALAILREAGAREIDGSNFLFLEHTIGEALARSRELVGPSAGNVSFTGPLEGLRAPPLLVNRVSLKPGSEILARGGRTPIVAIRQAGRGRVAASALSFEPAWGLGNWPDAGPFLRRLAAAVLTPDARLPADISLRFEDDRLEIKASMRSAERPDALEILVEGTPVVLARRGDNTYSRTMKHHSGTAAIRIGGRIAAVGRRPHALEFERVGPDLEALDELSKATGGRRLQSPRELSELPPRSSSEPRSARLLILAAALLLFLVDVGAGLVPPRPSRVPPRPSGR